MIDCWTGSSIRGEGAALVIRTLRRYLLGTVLVGVLLVAGVAVRVVLAGSGNQHAPADAIVVLGAAQYNGRPSDVYAARLDHAADLYRQHVAPRIITIGGGRTGDAVTEGEAGRRYLLNAGLDAGALTAVGTGSDTLVSLRATDQLLRSRGWTSVVLVTDPWHTSRSALIATDLGLSVQTSPVTAGPAVRAGLAPRYVVRETLGTLFYLLTGASSGLGPEVQ